MHTTNTFAVFAPLFPPAVLGGGPIRTIKALVDSAPLGTQPFIFTSDRDMRQSAPLQVASNVWTDSDGIPVYYATSPSIRLYMWGLWCVRNKRPQVTYYNSFFNPSFSLFPQLLGRLGFWRGAQVLLAPRGEFGKGALALRSSKKKLAIGVYKALGLHHRIVWHASSVAELKDIQDVFGAGARVLVREDETALPLSARLPPSARQAKSLRILFISRLNPMKGLDVLLRSLMLTETTMILDIYGNAEDKDYVRMCKRLIKELPANIACSMHGSIDPESVRDVFSEGDVFVFPTAGENFGHVVAEALSVSCPVISSDLTPWSHVLRSAGGDVLTSRDPVEWGLAIESYAALSQDQLALRRRAAGAAYNRWRAEVKAEHIFTLLANLNTS